MSSIRLGCILVQQSASERSLNEDNVLKPGRRKPSGLPAGVQETCSKLQSLGLGEHDLDLGSKPAKSRAEKSLYTGHFLGAVCPSRPLIIAPLGFASAGQR